MPQQLTHCDKKQRESIVDHRLPHKLREHALTLQGDPQRLVLEFIRCLGVKRHKHHPNTNPMYLVRVLEDLLFALKTEYHHNSHTLNQARKILKKALLVTIEEEFKQELRGIMNSAYGGQSD